jgi:hypothetical protein
MGLDPHSSGRRLKKAVLNTLQRPNFREALAPLTVAIPRRLINALISSLYYEDEICRWRAVVGMGLTVGAMVPSHMEWARVVMRRLMWSLNDESGGIGWGAPESMGEILAVCQPLAREYSHILKSYIHPDRNYLEYPPLQRGALWAIGRLGYSRPLNVRGIGHYLLPFMQSPDPFLRGLGAWAAGPVIGEPEIRAGLRKLHHDLDSLTLFRQDRLEKVSVGSLAREAAGPST